MHIKNKTEDLDIAISRYNLLEYSGNYSMTSGNLWNYYTEMKKMMLRMKIMMLVVIR